MKNILLRIKFYGVCSIIAFAMACMIAGWYIFPRRFKKKVRSIWGKSQMLLLKKPIIEGKFDDDTTMIVANHRSGLDIMVLEACCDLDMAWVAKSSISKIPFFGKIISKGEMIAVDREDKTSMFKMIKSAKQKLKEGRPIAIFPEGTRGNDYTMQEFQAGAGALANMLKLKVQPVVIAFSREILDLQNGIFSNKYRMHVKILPQVQASKETSWYEDMKENMQKELYELAKSDNHR